MGNEKVIAKFKVGDLIYAPMFPLYITRREIIGIKDTDYAVKFNDETVPTYLDIEWTDRNCERFTKLELAMK